MELNALLARSATLPSLPRVVALLMNELAQPDPNLRRINQLLGTDPALAARVLECANGSEFGAPQQVAGLAEALTLLSTGQLRTLVGSAPLGSTLRSVPGVNLHQFWRTSLTSAKLARSLAGVLGLAQAGAYTAGLLHALGELAIHLALPERTQALNAMVAPLDLRRALLEQRALGYAYGHVGAALARHWKLPTLVVDAIGGQHAPFENHNQAEPLAGVVHLAAWRARALEAGLDERELAVSFPDQVGLSLGLDIDMVLQQDPIDWTEQPDPDEDFFI